MKVTKIFEVTFIFKMKNMNLRLTFISLVVSSISLAQQIAESNKLLYAELVSVKLRNDSLKSGLNKEVLVFRRQLSTAKSGINGTMNTLNYNIEAENYYCNKLIDTLRNLSVNAPILEEKPLGLTNYYALCASLKPIFDAATKTISSVAQGTEEILPADADEQRKLLSERLNEEKKICELTEKEWIDLKKDLQTLERFNTMTPGYIANYTSQLADLKAYSKKLQEKRAEVKAKYAKSGPKGYPIAYRELFPDLFQEKDARLWNGKSVVYTSPVVVQEKVQTENEGGAQDELAAPSDKNTVDEQQFDPLRILEIVEKDAEFPGGPKAMGEYLRSNLHYPDFALDKALGGRCFVRFVITEKGEVKDVKVVRGVPFCEECDAEAIRVVSGMPNWIPGMNDGKPVNQWYNLPIKFTPY